MMSDLIEKVMAYEMGMMETNEEIIEFYQELVDTGTAWSLQGHYGRTARDLIGMGLITYDSEAGEDDDTD